MIVDVSAQLAELFPIGAIPIQIEVLPAVSSELATTEPRAVAVFRLIVWDVEGDNPTIRDIKEQELYLGWPAYYDDRQRIEAFVAALDGVIRELDVATVEVLMPHDLVDTSPLALKRARTREDFDNALRARSRLGKYLQAAAPEG